MIKQYIYRKSRASTKKGVHCSIIRYNASKTDLSTNLKSCKNTTDCEWQRSTYNDLIDFSPIYSANNLTTTLLQTKKHGFSREGMKVANRKNEDEDEEKLAFIKIVRERQKALPLNLNDGYFANSHNFVNRERVKRNILPLYRVRHLDELASEQAKIMAGQQSRDHSDLDTLISNIIKPGPCRRVGENVCRGKSIQLVHKKMMSSLKYATDKNNILDRRYSSFGIGVAPDINGIFYVCQIYKG